LDRLDRPYRDAMHAPNTTVARLDANAKQHIENLTPDQVASEREPDERAHNGRIDSAVHDPVLRLGWALRARGRGPDHKSGTPK